ncbi:MAG: ABC transporter ATP-binding protein, partial [Acidimicrobiales bacterium]
LVEAPVLVLDEPTAGLDQESGARLVADVAHDAGASGTSVIVVTHRAEDLEHLDHVVVMHNGRVARISDQGGPRSTS